MRRALDRLYRVSEYLAAGFVFAIFAMILAQVLLALLDRILGAVGLPALRLSVPAYAELASYMLVAAAFLGLAGTLVNGVHVRVTLVLQSVASDRVARAMTTLAAGLGLAATLFFFWRAVLLAHESWRFGDTSYGQIAIPLWVPQSSMGIGLAILAIAFADLVAGPDGGPDGGPERRE